MTYDASDRRDVRRVEKQARIADRENAEYLHHIMSTAHGRQWIAGRLELAFHTPYSPDPQVCSFNCGQQSTALELLAQVLATCPDEFILMMRESNERRYARERPERQNGAGNVEGSGAESGSDEATGDADRPEAS